MASPSLLSSDGYLESLLAVELKHRKKWWSEFISLNCIGTLIIPRKMWWSEVISLNCIGTLIIPRQGWSVIYFCAFFLTYPLSRHFPPVCGGCWLWYFRNGWGSWIRRLCGTVLRFGKLDRVHVKKPTDMKLDFEINIYLYVSFVVQVFNILKEYLTKFSIDEIWSSSWMMNVGSYEKGKIKKIRNTMYE